jgi:hypothetical protein
LRRCSSRATATGGRASATCSHAPAAISPQEP